MALEVGGGQRLFIGDVELGVAILEKFKIVLGLNRRQATLGLVQINDLLGVDELAVGVVQRRLKRSCSEGETWRLPLENSLSPDRPRGEAKSSRCRCWRPEEEARGSEEADEGPGAKTGLWGVTTGTCGAEPETLPRLTFSLGPAVGDLLSDPSLVSKGIRLSNVFIIVLTRSKKAVSNTVVY